MPKFNVTRFTSLLFASVYLLFVQQDGRQLLVEPTNPAESLNQSSATLRRPAEDLETHLQPNGSARERVRLESLRDSPVELELDLDTPTVTNRERAYIQSVLDRFNSSLPRVASTDAQANLMLDFYRTQAGFARPRAVGAIIVASADANRAASSLFIIVISERETRNLGDPNAHLSTFRYRSDMPAILMDPRLLTEPWEEAILLHEVFHAYIDRERASPPEEERFGNDYYAVSEEAEAHAMQYRTLNNWTGGRYRTVLERLALARIRGIPDNLYQQIILRENNELDSLFAPCTGFEHTIRLVQYEMDLSVTIDRLLVLGDEMTARVRSLRRIYTRISARD